MIDCNRICFCSSLWSNFYIFSYYPLRSDLQETFGISYCTRKLTNYSSTSFKSEQEQEVLNSQNPVNSDRCSFASLCAFYCYFCRLLQLFIIQITAKLLIIFLTPKIRGKHLILSLFFVLLPLTSYNNNAFKNFFFFLTAVLIR